MEGSGAGSATAEMFCAAGGVSGGATAFSVPPQANCPPVEDPLADMDMPAVGVCIGEEMNEDELWGFNTFRTLSWIDGG